MLIFVIDDDLSVAGVISEFLLNYGYEIVTFHNGHDAIEHLDTRLPDLVITDVEMPGMDGLALRSQMTRICPQCKFLLMTGGQFQEDGILRKPINLQVLLSRVRQLLEEEF